MDFVEALTGLGINVYGSQIKISCPYHLSDIRPSLSIDVDKGVFFCFGCSKSGGATQLIAQLSGTDELSVLRSLGSLGLSRSRQRVSDEEQDKIRYKLLIEARHYFSGLNRPEWSLIQDHYLYGRGIESRTLKRFDVRIDSTREYPTIMPITEGGIFKGYVTRRHDKHEPKYLYNAGFRRKATVFGHLKRGAVMVVEGPLDLLSAYQHGFRNVCCSLGSMISDEQIKKIDRGADLIICAFDADDAGSHGFKRIRSIAKTRTVRLRMPEGVNDVNEMSREQFRESLKRLSRRM